MKHKDKYGTIAVTKKSSNLQPRSVIQDLHFKRIEDFPKYTACLALCQQLLRCIKHVSQHD